MGNFVAPLNDLNNFQKKSPYRRAGAWVWMIN
jgi:hypothetical protein